MNTKDTDGEQIMNRLGLEPLYTVLHECEVCGAPVADENRDKHNRECHP